MRRSFTALWLGGIMLGCSPATPPVDAAVVANQVALEETIVPYEVGGHPFEGRYIAPKDPRGAIVFGPDWYGIYDYPLEEARKMARHGFAVLLADVYGAGVRPTNDDDAGKLASALRTDRATLRGRMVAAQRELAARVPPGTKIAGFGFSLGGAAVLELARAGTDLAGVVVLSGILDAQSPADAAHIRTPVLVLHGTADVVAPMDQIATFVRDMDAEKRTYNLELFGGAAHAFTNPKFAGITEGPFRYSAKDATRADAEVIAFLDAHLHR